MILDVLGTLGALLIVGVYLLLQLERLRATSVAYSAWNALGAGLILISLTRDFNLGAAVVEFFWLLVSALGLWRAWSRRGAAAT